MVGVPKFLTEGAAVHRLRQQRDGVIRSKVQRDLAAAVGNGLLRAVQRVPDGIRPGGMQRHGGALRHGIAQRGEPHRAVQVAGERLDAHRGGPDALFLLGLHHLAPLGGGTVLRHGADKADAGRDAQQVGLFVRAGALHRDGIGVAARRVAHLDDHAEPFPVGQRHRLVQPDGVVAGVGLGAGLAGHQHSAVGAARLHAGVDRDGVLHIHIGGVKGHRLQQLAHVGTLRLKDVGHVRRAGGVPVVQLGGQAGFPAKAVMLVVVVIVVGALHQIDRLHAQRGILVGDPEIPGVPPAGAVVVAHQPRAGILRAAVGREVVLGKRIVPAHQQHGVVLGGGGQVVDADITVVAVVPDGQRAALL